MSAYYELNITGDSTDACVKPLLSFLWELILYSITTRKHFPMRCVSRRYRARQIVRFWKPASTNLIELKPWRQGSPKEYVVCPVDNYSLKKFAYLTRKWDISIFMWSIDGFACFQNFHFFYRLNWWASLAPLWRILVEICAGHRGVITVYQKLGTPSQPEAFPTLICNNPGMIFPAEIGAENSGSDLQVISSFVDSFLIFDVSFHSCLALDAATCERWLSLRCLYFLSVQEHYHPSVF